MRTIEEMGERAREAAAVLAAAGSREKDRGLAAIAAALLRSWSTRGREVRVISSKNTYIVIRFAEKFNPIRTPATIR